MAITRLTNRKRGFTIFFAMLVGSLALSIGLAIFDLTLRELELSGTATQSQYAMYAADTGVECALYWDLKCTSCAASAGGSAFATSSDSVIPFNDSSLLCNGNDISSSTSRVVVKPLNAGAATTTFMVYFSPQPYCVQVQVEKSGTPTQTTITSRGYNTCSTGALNRLERVLQVTY